ncbi:SLOG family protein [Streptomyces fradiae]|uniref:SLOG family protein n=1 Tax=Streptomyces fradiae TaxID=1906 RepID=UPI0034095916
MTTPTPTGRPYRVLVTGSRDWTDTLAVAAALEQSVIDAGPCPILVVHGACPTGADRHADTHARQLRNGGVSIDIERHPAKGHPTQDFGPWPCAGPRRNAHMVSLGADVCLAFIGPCTSPRCPRTDPHDSHGASGCVRLAEAAGIPVRRWTA